jgi:hypothetical protein
VFGSDILEVAIGLVLVFLLVSVMCSAVREGIESWLKTRAAYLERGIRELLHDKLAKQHEAKGGKSLARAFYEHPLIFGLYSSGYTPGAETAHPPLFMRGRGLPSYIPARNFALALMDIAARGPTTDAVSADADAPPLSIESMRNGVQNIGNPAVQRLLLMAIDTAHDDIEQVRESLQKWYDSGMDRVSGWYKRGTARILFFIGLIISVAMNVDAITIARYLYHNDAARAVIVAQAQKTARDSAGLEQSYAQTKADLDSLQLPIGWSAAAISGGTPTQSAAALGPPWYLRALGWIITALAATMGAPFWFDVLNKFMVIRSTVKPHEKSPEESSEDRQRPKDKALERESSNGASSTPSTEPPRQFTLPPPRFVPSIRDAASGIDGCDVDMAKVGVTADEDLPAAEGGVG